MDESIPVILRKGSKMDDGFVPKRKGSRFDDFEEGNADENINSTGERSLLLVLTFYML